MAAIVQHTDFWFFSLKVASRNLGQHPFEKHFESIQQGIRDDLLNPTDPIKALIRKRIPEIFHLRLAAIHWMAMNNRLSDKNFLELDIVFLKKMQQHPLLKKLSEKIAISLFLNKEGVKAILPAEDVPQISEEIPEISFQYWTIMMRTLLPPAAATPFIDWVKCSLFIEYITLAGFLIFDENPKLKVSEARITQLTYLLDETNKAYASYFKDFFSTTGKEEQEIKGSSQQPNTKGGAYFKKMLDDKNAIHQHLQSGGDLSDLKDQFGFVNPLSTGK